MSFVQVKSCEIVSISFCWLWKLIDSCVAPVPLSSVASLKFESVHAVLAEGDGFQICQRLVRAWNYGEALHAAFATYVRTFLLAFLHVYLSEGGSPTTKSLCEDMYVF